MTVLVLPMLPTPPLPRHMEAHAELKTFVCISLKSILLTINDFLS